jgi:exopolysaccharide biosynthesis predicted pyruvyltransferase EpsI
MDDRRGPRTGSGDVADPLIADLQQRLDATLRDVLAGERRVALVNFPNHGNAGDPAIWLGARAALRRAGVRIAYQSSWRTFDPLALRRALPRGPVLINGGGNFGDLYPGGQQGLRERLLGELTDRRLVQLPQSIHFQSPAERDRVARLVAQHGDVTLMVREERSVELVERHFPSVQPVLAPDMVFGLGARPRPTAPRYDVVWLMRADKEAVSRGAPAIRPQERLVDWLDPSTMPPLPRRSLAREVNRVLSERVGRGGRTPVPAWRPLAWTFTPLARDWVQSGMASLAEGRVVVTDKLHGHLFALLLGIPHVVLDNSYGKVRATVDTWTGKSPLVHWAESPEEAREVADRLLEGSHP